MGVCVCVRVCAPTCVYICVSVLRVVCTSKAVCMALAVSVSFHSCRASATIIRSVTAMTDSQKCHKSGDHVVGVMRISSTACKPFNNRNGTLY